MAALLRATRAFAPWDAVLCGLARLLLILAHKATEVGKQEAKSFAALLAVFQHRGLIFHGQRPEHRQLPCWQAANYVAGFDGAELRLLPRAHAVMRIPIFLVKAAE